MGPLGMSSARRLWLMNMLDAFDSLGRGDCLGDIAPFARPHQGLKHAGLRPSLCLVLFCGDKHSYIYQPHPLDMRRDVQEIFRATPHHKQVMMFSATLAKEIRVTCKKFMANVRFLKDHPQPHI